MSDGRSVDSEEAAAGHRAGVGDVLADAAEPAAIAFACAWGLDCFDEAVQALVGVWGSAAVALVPLRRGAGDLGGDGLGRAVVGRALAGGAVVEAAQLRGPRRANAYAERWVHTTRSEVTDRMLISGPRHLYAVLEEYAGHCSRHRPHRARNLRPPDSDDVTMAEIADLAAARIRRRRVLGGLINEYEQAA
jgi:hypothetical protein